MFRRLLKSLSVAVALLGLALPAAACFQQTECCPARAPVPCGECPDLARHSALGAVCAATPATTAAVAVPGSPAVTLNLSSPPPDVESGDIFRLTARRATPQASAPWRASLVGPHATTPTFLATRRLRI